MIGPDDIQPFQLTFGKGFIIINQILFQKGGSRGWIAP